VALLALRAGARAEDEAAVVSTAKNAKFEFRQLLDGNLLHIDGICVHKDIRTEQVSALASKVSALPGVRDLLLGLQRCLGDTGGVVLEGRDIGTVVFPKAQVKVFLTASIEARAKRRAMELSAKGEIVDLGKVKEEMALRDKQDSERPIAPLKQAQDAVVVDTSTMSIDSVLDQLESLVRERS
jgi:cytidylate kinase